MATSSWVATANSVPIDRKRVIGELTRGRDITERLRRMLRESGVAGTAAAKVLPPQELVGEILDTFTQSISILRGGGDSDEVSQVPAVINSPGRKSEDSGDSCKTPAPKDRRGCYKRRRTEETFTKETSALFEDGHAWRKYGQKVILHAKHPRNYYRCTHKFDQGCQATKQVQRIRDDPPQFRTTYHGNHTCKNMFRSSHQIIVDADADNSSIIWSFTSQALDYKPNNGAVINSSTSTVVTGAIKQEKKEVEYDHQVKVKSSPPPTDGDYFIAPELTAFDHNATDHLGAFSSASEHGDVLSSDVYSCTASTHSLDVDIMVDSVFDDLLELN